MSYGQAVECDTCKKVEFYHDTLDRAPSQGRLPHEGWVTIPQFQGFSSEGGGIFCGAICASKFLEQFLPQEGN